MRKRFLIVARWLLIIGAACQFLDSAVILTSQQPEPFCEVGGRVSESTTNRPVKRATVRLYSLEKNWQRVTTTGSQGQFVFKDVPFGRYKLQAEATGYLMSFFGERSPGEGGADVLLLSSEHPRSFELHLTPAAVISGTVRDEDGSPIMGASVSALRPEYGENFRKVFPNVVVQTDDRGQYRIYPLTPGKYLVLVNYRGSVEDPSSTYLPTLYPDTPDASQARWIEVSAGQEVSNTDIQMIPTEAACVRGRVTNLVPSKNQTVPYIQLLPTNMLFSPYRVPSNYLAPTVNDRGEFQICGVPPGSYFADANYHDGERQYRGHTDVEVESSGGSEITIPLSLPIEIRGRVQTDASAPFDFTPVQVWLRAKDDSGGGAGGKMNPDGSFVISDVFGGSYRLQIAGFPEEFYVKSARSGGRDILAEGLTTEEGRSAQSLDILLSVNGGRIDGSVFRDLKPASGAIAAFVPDAAHRDQDERYSMGKADAQGKFTLLGLPPGDYTLYAFETVNTLFLKDPEFLQAHARYAKPVHVEEKQQQRVDLELIPRDQN